MRYLPLLCLTIALRAGGPGLVKSKYTKQDIPLTADPASPAWSKTAPIIVANGRHGEPIPNHRTEIRTRWSTANFYVLFVCPYESLHLKPNPTTTEETNKLWDWDVAEVFIGSDFSNIHRYKEFEMSPQGEWVDLDIDRDHPLPEGGWRWNSGFAVKARIDAAKKVWYGEMRIPFDQLDKRPPKAGHELRINFYRCQGSAPRRYIAWQPTNGPSFHVPEAFGRLRLVK